MVRRGAFALMREDPDVTALVEGSVPVVEAEVDNRDRADDVVIVTPLLRAELMT